jgi:PAS domain S-box-containing protein
MLPLGPHDHPVPNKSPTSFSISAYYPRMVIDVTEALRALDHGEFLPYFQPLVVLRTGQLAGFEVLARWKHSKAGMIQPDTFIPLAERDGWIGALTHEILRKAFTSALSIPESVRLSVNISPIQLRDLSLPAQLESVSDQTGFSLNRVVVEITESALAQNLEQARIIAVELKALGCKLALDDFGTGYSSLRHLQSLPFDELKVDRSFVSSMADRRESRKIVAAIVGLGQSLGMTTVAEGVETQEQAEMLLWLGCEIGQGWLCGRPAPAQELHSMLAAPRQGVSTGSAFPWKDLSIGNLEGLPAQRLAQLQAVYDGAPVGLGFLDRDLRFVNLNRQLADLNGKSIEEHLGKTAEELVPELYPKFEPYLRRALQGESITGFELKRPDIETGDEITLLASYQPARDEAGEVVGVSVALVDFTARKRAEEKLQQYERVVEGLEEMIVVVDRDYRYVLANRAFLEYRGTTKEQVIGRLVPDWLDKEIFERVVKGKLDDCFKGNIVKYEMNYTYPQLGERNLFISYFPIEVSGGVTGAACVLRDMTELKRMTRANQNWQKRMELAREAGLRIGLWDWDVSANTVDWSDETYRQWGFTPEAFSGRVEDAVGRIHPADRPGVERAIQDVLAGKESQYASQYRVVRPDGGTCWINAHGVIVRDGSTHMLGVGVDITDLKATEASLQESEERYLLLLNSTAEAIYGIDIEGNCTYRNPACLRLLGYSEPDGLLGKNMHRLVHHSHADGAPYPIEECVTYVAIHKGIASHVTDEVLWRRDGTMLPVEYWSYPMSKGGTVVGAVVTFIDISIRRRTEQALRQSEEKYRGLFENAIYGIFRARTDGTLLDVNPAMQTMLGYSSKEEMLTRNLNRDLYVDPAVRAAILQKLEPSGRVDAAQAEWKRRDGEIITVRLTGRLIPGENQSTSHMEVMVEDITKEQFKP